MTEIELLSPDGFAKYLDKYSNTICGRHPIGVLLQVRYVLRTLQSLRDSLFVVGY